MDAQMAKELQSLHYLIDNVNADGIAGDCKYTDYYSRGNVKFSRGRKSSQAIREDFLLPDNPEHSELDWWLMYILSNLRLADVNTIIRVLKAEKLLHTELLFCDNYEKLVRKRLNYLTRLGFVMEYVYVSNTSVETFEADEKYNKFLRLLEDEAVRQRAAGEAVDVDHFFDEDDDEYSEEDIEMVDYNNREYFARQGTVKQDMINSGLASMRDQKFAKQFYGENAHVHKLYSLEDNTYRIVATRFSAAVPFTANWNPIYQLTSRNFGQAAVSGLAGRLVELSSYRELQPGKVYSKINGLFYAPAELVFSAKVKSGEEITYNCGIFYAYSYKEEGRITGSHAKANLKETVYRVKNYIGVRADIRGDRPDNEAFAIVVVNDTVDLIRFMNMYIQRMNPAECSRLFFTGEGIYESNVGVSKMIGITIDETQESGYSFYPRMLPIL